MPKIPVFNTNVNHVLPNSYLKSDFKNITDFELKFNEMKILSEKAIVTKKATDKPVPHIIIE